ncbi:uncharacterized protein LOC123632164 [Lemur catta]|uniref:uncharacterized protein LOC123632164 n=1 Tax=Lemur catta TaxID=9447 RepID=UPI001E26DE78|nr:uncharacterized protein LOC123632164 [Lemur catta]
MVTGALPGTGGAEVGTQVGTPSGGQRGHKSNQPSRHLAGDTHCCQQNFSGGKRAQWWLPGAPALPPRWSLEELPTHGQVLGGLPGWSGRRRRGRENTQSFRKNLGGGGCRQAARLRNQEPAGAWHGPAEACDAVGGARPSTSAHCLRISSFLAAASLGGILSIAVMMPRSDGILGPSLQIVWSQASSSRQSRNPGSLSAQRSRPGPAQAPLVPASPGPTQHDGVWVCDPPRGEIGSDSPPNTESTLSTSVRTDGRKSTESPGRTRGNTFLLARIYLQLSTSALAGLSRKESNMGSGASRVTDVSGGAAPGGTFGSSPGTPGPGRRMLSLQPGPRGAGDLGDTSSKPTRPLP